MNGRAERAGKAPVPRISRKKKFFFAFITNLSALIVLFGVAEIGLRSYRLGGFVEALASLVPTGFSTAEVPADNWIVPDPELGYRLNPNNEDCNSLGFRHGPIERPKPPGLFRLLVIGDSVAWDENGFVSMLHDEFSNREIEVINAAVPGFTTYQERLFLERIAGPVEPDLVLLQFCLNDNHRFLHMLSDGGHWLFTPEARQALYVEGNGPLARFSRWSHVVLLLRKRLYARRIARRPGLPWERDPAFVTAWRDETWAESRAQLRAIRKTANDAGAEFRIVVIPYEPQLDPELLAKDRHYVLKPQRHLAAICESEGIPLLDLHEVFRTAGEKALYEDRVHLTASGHRVAANAIREWLEAGDALK